MIFVLVGSPRTLNVAASLNRVTSGFMARLAEATFRLLMHKTSQIALLSFLVLFILTPRYMNVCSYINKNIHLVKKNIPAMGPFSAWLDKPTYLSRRPSGYPHCFKLHVAREVKRSSEAALSDKDGKRFSWTFIRCATTAFPECRKFCPSWTPCQTFILRAVHSIRSAAVFQPKLGKRGGLRVKKQFDLHLHIMYSSVQLNNGASHEQFA